MTKGSPQLCGSRAGRRRARPVDCRKHFAAGAPVVLWKIDLDPRIAAAFDDVQRTAGDERGKRSRQPLALDAAGHDLMRDLDQRSRAVRSEFREADVLAVHL